MGSAAHKGQLLAITFFLPSKHVESKARTEGFLDHPSCEATPLGSKVKIWNMPHLSKSLLHITGPELLASQEWPSHHFPSLQQTHTLGQMLRSREFLAVWNVSHYGKYNESNAQTPTSAGVKEPQDRSSRNHTSLPRSAAKTKIFG